MNPAALILIAAILCALINLALHLERVLQRNIARETKEAK